LPEAFEDDPPLLVPAEGSAMTVDCPGATANKERASPSGTLATTSGGGGTAFNTNNPCLSRLLTGTSDVCAGAAIGLGGGACGITGSADANCGRLLVEAVGSFSFGAATGFSTGRIASLPFSTFITGFGGSDDGGGVAMARFGSGKFWCRIGGFSKLGRRIV
jgi:hypothetical protein